MARPNFIELPAREYEKSKSIYQRVFAWTLTEFGPSYACTLSGDVWQRSPQPAARS
jgi:predicted enzyme related to lactoylglutathione lyase